MKKRFSAFLLAALMVAALLPAVSFAAVTEVSTTEAAQAALDAAVDGTHIKLAPGSYGTLYLRKNGNSAPVESNWAGGGPHTFKTTFTNLTIEGGEGVTVAAIVAESGIYLPGGSQHSNSGTAPRLQSYIEIENLTIKGITFNLTGSQVAVKLANNCTSIDGLMIDSCVVNATGSTTNSGARLLNSDAQRVVEYTEKGVKVMDGLRSNITVKNCQLNNLHQGIKINYVDGLTVENNQFSGIKGRDLLIGGGSANMTGTVKILGNSFDGSTERVLRMSGFNGTLVMNNNTITNYAGADDDYIKVAEGTPASVSTSGNTFEGQSFVLNTSGGSMIPGNPPAYAGPVMNWVKVNAADNGVVKSGPLAASAGATVTLYPKAAEGYVLDTVEVLDAEGNAVELDGLKFAIPAGGVTVNATFKLAD